MFTHPSLLRELNTLAEFLRRSGEAEWARRIVTAADAVRKQGWTAAGAAQVQALYRSEPGLHQISFGVEHHRWVGGDAGAAKANDRLERLRVKLADLASLPVQAPQVGPRPRSPDLAP